MSFGARVCEVVISRWSCIEVPPIQPTDSGLALGVKHDVAPLFCQIDWNQTYHESKYLNKRERYDNYLKWQKPSTEFMWCSHWLFSSTHIPSANMEWQDLWPILQPDTRGRLRCFGFTIDKLSSRPSFFNQWSGTKFNVRTIKPQR